MAGMRAAITMASRITTCRAVSAVSAGFHDVRLPWLKGLIGHNKDATPPRPCRVPTSCEYSRHARRPVGCVSGSEARARRAARDQAAARARVRGVANSHQPTP